MIYRLTKTALQEMEDGDHEAGLAFHKLVVRLLAERVMATNEIVTALLQ